VSDRSNSRDGETELVEALSADILHTLAAVRFAAFLVDRDRRIRWQNDAAIELVGDVRGLLDASIVAPEDLAVVREHFARKLLGAGHTDYEVSIVRPNGTRARLDVSSVPLAGRDRSVVGVLALARVLTEVDTPAEAAGLTPREHQTLTLLAAGCSTPRMAELMGISNETVRNHVKGLRRRLGARSRVEAVAKARRAGLI
jgi:DNA-binding CsgD family transcriptional regulator